MAPAFVTGVGVGLPATHSKGRLVTALPSRTVVAKRGGARMMAESSGQKESLMDWLYNKIMHNFSSEVGYETYFKPIEERREKELEQMYKEKKDNAGK